MRDQLVMLHGFTGSATDWLTFRAKFSEYTVVTPSITGHGIAPKPQSVSAYAMENAARYIVESVLPQPFHLLGYSMGGQLALYIALHYPERVQSLILESASPGLKTQAERDERRARDDALADKIEANGIEWFVNFWESLPLWDTQTDEQKAYLRTDRLQNDPIGLANSLRGMGTGVMPNLWDTLHELTIPVQLIVGQHDKKFVNINREMLQYLPNATLQIVPDAGHTVHLEQPAAFTQIVRKFLSSQV